MMYTFSYILLLYTTYTTIITNLEKKNVYIIDGIMLTLMQLTVKQHLKNELSLNKIL